MTGPAMNTPQIRSLRAAEEHRGKPPARGDRLDCRVAEAVSWLVLALAGFWLGGCASKGAAIPDAAGEAPKVRLGPVLMLFELKPGDFAPNVRAIVDAAGQAHVLIGCDIKTRTETFEILVGADAVLERRFIVSAEPRFIQSTNSIPWDAIDGAFDGHGALHALVGDRHLVLADGTWRPSAPTPWQEAGIKVESARFVRGAPGLIWALELKGKDVGAHARWDVWGFGNALGAVIWPWRTHGRRTVIVPEIDSGYPSWEVLDPRGKKDTLTKAVAADRQSNVHVLYSEARGGIFSGDNYQSGMPPALMGEAYYARIPAQQAVRGAAEESVRPQTMRESRQLRAFTGQLQRRSWSPVSLAVDPGLGTALVGTQWRLNGGEWSGPLKGSMIGYGRVAPAGRDRFHAIMVGNGLTDWRIDTKDIPLLYMLLSGRQWSASLELGAVSARDALGFMPDKIDIVDAPNGRAFVVWPTRAGVVGRWIETDSQ